MPIGLPLDGDHSQQAFQWLKACFPSWLREHRGAWAGWDIGLSIMISLFYWGSSMHSNSVSMKNPQQFMEKGFPSIGGNRDTPAMLEKAGLAAGWAGRAPGKLDAPDTAFGRAPICPPYTCFSHHAFTLCTQHR